MAENMASNQGGVFSVTGVKPGTTDITLTAGTVTRTIPVTVLPAEMITGGDFASLDAWTVTGDVVLDSTHIGINMPAVPYARIQADAGITQQVTHAGTRRLRLACTMFNYGDTARYFEVAASGKVLGRLDNGQGTRDWAGASLEFDPPADSFTLTLTARNGATRVDDITLTSIR